MISTTKASFDYIRRDEDNNVVEIKRAMDDISVSIKKGSFVAILGHNGSGKSTFAKHLNALLQPTEGKVRVSHMSTSKHENIWNIRKKVGMVFQNPDNQIVASVVEEDVGFGPENLGVSTENILQRVKNSLKAVDMLKFRKKSPNHLSGGQKQRVAIAGVMAMNTDCIVLDEPTAMLDPIGRKEVMDTIYRLNKQEGKTVVLITHYMEEVALADQVIVMDQGKVVMEGTPREIFSKSEELKKYRLTVPEVTTLAEELRKEGAPISKTILTEDELVAELLYWIKK